MRTVAIISCKAGIGEATLAYSLAVIAQSTGRAVIVLGRDSRAPGEFGSHRYRGVRLDRIRTGGNPLGSNHGRITNIGALLLACPSSWGPHGVVV